MTIKIFVPIDSTAQSLGSNEIAHKLNLKLKKEI